MEPLLPASPHPPPPDPALAALSSLADQGQNPLDLLQSLLSSDATPDTATRPDVPVPGQANALAISLSEKEEQDLANELCDLVEEYFSAMADRREREAEIRDAYAQKFNAAQGGNQPDSASLSSEMMTSFVDQAAARLTTNFMDAKPAVAVDVARGAGIDGDESDQLAEDTEHFLDSYTMNEMDFIHLLPVAFLRAAKVGTVVFYLTWEEEKRVRWIFRKDAKKAQKKVEVVGRVAPKLLDNDRVIIWPPTVINWQRDYQFVGHEEYLTPDQWRDIAARYKLSKELTEEIESLAPEEKDASLLAESERQGINAAQLTDEDSLKPIKVTELWCDMVLPGGDEREKFQVILNRSKRKILWIGYNGFHSQCHPYWPIRYKWGDNSCWGTGIGDEILNNHSADTALWNLELDNLYAGAYWAILRRTGSIYNTQSDNPRPGMVIAVDDVNADFKPIQLGGGVPAIGETRTENQSRAASGSGLSSVMFGQGDPVQKSGTGTGATNALIEQGNKKLAAIDRNIRTDVSAIYEFILELIAQYAQEGIFYRRVGQDAAGRLTRLLYTPPRGDISQMFQFRAQAPSVATTDEARKNGYMMIWTFATAQSQIVDQYVTQLLQANNPAAIPSWKKSIVDYLNQIAKKVIEFTDMPGVIDYIPQAPDPTPQDQVINQQSQQIQQLEAQLQQAQQQLQQLAQQGMNMAGGGQPPGQPGAQQAPPAADGSQDGGQDGGQDQGQAGAQGADQTMDMGGGSGLVS